MLQTMAHEIGHWVTDDHKGGQDHDYYKAFLNTMNG
jgi:hypothetical protein